MHAYRKCFLSAATFVVSSFVFLFPHQSQALVDYSDETSAAPKRTFTPKSSESTSPSTPSRAASSTASARGDSRGPLIFAFAPRYEVITVKKSNHESKVRATGLEARVNSPWNFHLDMKYAMYATDDEELSNETSTQQGNPELKVGIDWLDLGGAQDRTTITLIAGASLAARNSTLGSSRTDKIVGLETTKRFYSFGLGLGYELHLVGNPALEEEMEIGNIHHIYGGFDFELSPDITVGVMADNYNVGAKSGSSRANHLENNLSFSSVATSLTLRPQGIFAIELGARFSTKRVQSPESLASARLWSLPGAYGNTIYTGIGVSF
ncbi:MAG: hypothetical protein A2X86_01570 [Bdellovibrionales bacterium GWA2_49_15]|nr:MAG: hypothetical protein A2X86_01570 [Bdellovibrionales bacterium GWA2_49_15]